MKELPEVVEQSSEDEEEEVDHELVEKKVKVGTAGDDALGVPHCHCQVLVGTGDVVGCSSGWDITRCLQGPGTLLDANRGRDVARCL